MAGYPNGQIPASALTALATAPGQRLDATAARQWDALARSVQALHGWMPLLTDSYRPLDVQVRILRERYTTTPLFSTAGLTQKNGGLRIYGGQTWYRRPGQATVAPPGTSNHGWGKAVDVSGLGGFGGARYAQLAALAARFGFTNTEGRSIGEPWHWGFTGAFTVSHPITSGGTVTTPTIPGAPAPLTPEDDMTPDQDKALARALQILEGLDGYVLGGRGRQADDLVLGVLPNRKDANGAPRRVLDTGDGDVLAAIVRDTNAAAREIHDRVNWATYADGRPMLIAVQGDVDLIMRAVTGITTPTAAPVDVERLADLLRANLGDTVVDALAARLGGAK